MRGELIFDVPEMTGDQRKQVAGLGKGIMPARPVPAIVEGAAAGQIAVGEQRRIAALVGHQGRGEHRHRVGPVEKVGDFAETLGLALGAEIAAGLVKPFQRSVVLRADPGDDRQFKRLRRIAQGQVIGVDLIAIGGERCAIQFQRDQFKLLSVQHQRRSSGRGLSTDDSQP